MFRVRTLPEALADAARSGEGYIFIDHRGETRRSYAEIYDASVRAARAFRKLGLRPGDLVALIIAEAEQFLCTLFGASIAGVVPASLYPPAPTADLQHYIASTAATVRFARARAVVTAARFVDSFGRWRSSCPELTLVIAYEPLAAEAGNARGRLAADASDCVREASADDIAFVQFTSGSTSAPKGVAVSHRSLSANIEAINGPAGLATGASDSAVSWLPLHHDMGLVGMALGAMYAGRPAVLMAPERFVKRPAEWLRAISRHRGTVSFAPSFAYDLCVRRVKPRDLEGIDLTCWRVAGCGGEPIHAQALAAFAEAFRVVGFRDTSFVPSYGLAEHVLAATLAPRGRPLRVAHLSAGDVAGRVAGISPENARAEQTTIVSCGPCLPGHRLRIVDENGRNLPDGAIGEIMLAGPSVMKGYYSDDDLTSETLRDGWLGTGDLGYLSDGELFVCGRIKDIVIVNGRKHHPHDLEWVVDDVAGVRRGRVVAFGAMRIGAQDRVVIVVEPSGTVSAETLTETIRQRVAVVCGLHVDEIVLVPSGAIGRTTSGKVQRSATKERYERGEFSVAPSVVSSVRSRHPRD
jgi:fatty-acyl-CoA synthase